MGLTGQYGTDLNGLTSGLFQNLNNSLGALGRTHVVRLHHYFAGIGIGNGLGNIPAGKTVFQGLDGLAAVHKGLDLHVGDLAVLAAVYFTDDQVLRYVYQTSGQITGVSRTESRIGQTLTCTVCGDEVLQYVQTLTEVGLNGKLDGMSGGICHQTAHTCQLLDLLIGTTGSGVGHHEDVGRSAGHGLTGRPYSSRFQLLLYNAPPR